MAHAQAPSAEAKDQETRVQPRLPVSRTPHSHTRTYLFTFPLLPREAYANTQTHPNIHTHTHANHAHNGQTHSLFSLSSKHTTVRSTRTHAHAAPVERMKRPPIVAGGALRAACAAHRV
eukprot:2457840-Pleurochrysis_carterae.AAC.10